MGKGICAHPITNWMLVHIAAQWCTSQSNGAQGSSVPLQLCKMQPPQTCTHTHRFVFITSTDDVAGKNRYAQSLELQTSTKQSLAFRNTASVAKTQVS